MSHASKKNTGPADDPVETDQAGKDRDRTADDRDKRAEAHDQASQERDDRATARDKRADARELADSDVDPSGGAAADRAGALRDRRGGASDRTQAADDRQAASADRVISARGRAASSLDGLTMTYRREAGVAELEREIARARRTKQSFVLAFVDVDQLKATNDTHGHPAGDRLLRYVADTIRKHLRSYDLIIRYGGDEFICALADVSMNDAEKRFSDVNTDLAERKASVTVGMAMLADDDSLEDLVARADKAMYEKRNG